MPQEKLIQNPEKIRLNANDEIQQILGNPPGWLLQWGISLIFLSVMVFLALAWLIKYPDIVSADAKITTQNPPIRVMAFSRGKIKSLLVKDKQAVNENELLAILEDPADYKDIQILEDKLNAVSVDNIAVFSKLKLPEKLALGALQNSYSGLSQKTKDLQYFIKTNIAAQKILALEEQIAQTGMLNASLRKQETILSEEVRLSEEAWNRTKQMLKDGSGSKLDIEAAESSFLQQKRQLENLRANTVNNNIGIEQLKVQILELGRDKQDVYSTKLLAIQKDISNIKTEIKNWKQNFIITAPIAGKISMAKVLSPNQFVNANENIMAIVPHDDAGKIICRAALLPAGAGKVREQMDVNIQLDGFPYQEFGVIKAKVNYISLLPDEENFIAEIHIPDSLIVADSILTTYKKKIHFRQEMKAVAQIIAEEKTIFQRIFDKILDVIYNQ